MTRDLVQTASASSRRLLLPGTWALLACTVACQSVIDAPFDEAEPRQVAASCKLVKPLPPPGVLAAPGDLEITVIVNENDLAEGTAPDGTPAYYHLGYDVDDTCTVKGAAPRCVTPEWTGADPSDGPGGVDNGVGRMLFLQPQIFPVGLVTTELFNTRMKTGQLAPTALIRIANYNGAVADEDVEVEIFVPHTPVKLAETFVPRFDGSDVWPVLAEYVENPSAAELRASLKDVEAYVVRSELVARFGPGTISFLNMPIRFESVTLSGTLELDPQLLQQRLTNGVLSGYARSDELLRAIPYGAFETLGIKICSSDENYPDVKKLLCTGADMIDSASGGAARPCNLTTFALGLSTVPVKLGAALPAPAPSAICPPEADPGNDSCAIPPTAR
jgi:hypothetical protein